LLERKGSEKAHIEVASDPESYPSDGRIQVAEWDKVEVQLVDEWGRYHCIQEALDYATVNGIDPSA
jgi:hypothetical protein